ncbi:MAG: hypothetical protein M3O34_15190 [Chloroflexota bacterium]|nr:hypothetical protein [Chloroflexota bacterium]
MPRQNLIFMIVTPLVLLAVIAVGVIGIGELLLAVGDWAHHAYDVDHLAGDQRHQAEEIAKLYPVAVALGIGALALIGGSVASRMAGNHAPRGSARH